MSGKRALIVDDSRSARVILSRMLEGYGLEVDAVESAEQALEYLRQAQPDVIFMDHLMPGMDGFQAIQTIKNNPLTALIPVMMYTSQEGELYVSQARALGAVGVLPKTIKQTELSRILYQLRLLPERRDPRIVVHPAETAPIEEAAPERPNLQIDSPRPPASEIEIAIRKGIGPALQEQNVEIRQFVAASLDAFARRINESQSTAATEPQATPEEVSATTPAEPASLRWPAVAAMLALSLVPTIVLAVLHMRTLDSTTQMMQSNARLSTVITEQQAQLATLQERLTASIPDFASQHERVAGAIVESETVPYGEVPLAGPRLERLRELATKLTSEGFRGTVRVATHVGEFCLVGNGMEGYTIAADELPMNRCDRVGNPFDESLTGAQRQSVAFANLVSTLKQQSAEALAIEIVHAGRRATVPYPEGERLSKLTAGDWNRIAVQNNRVEFAALPAS